MAGVIIRGIVVPDGSVVVNMDNEQAFTGNSSVPSCLLTVLQQVVLVLVTLIIYDVALATQFRSLQVIHFGCCCQFYWFAPTCHPALITGIACRTIAIVVVRTAIHKVPLEHTLTAAVVGIVEVGIAQTVTELVAHGSNTCQLSSLTIKLCSAGVCVNLHSVKCLHTASVTIYLCFRKSIGMWPYCRGSATIGLTLTGIHYIHLIYISVTVPVVIGIVHLTVCQFQSLDNHRTRVHIVAFAIVLTIVGLCL